MDSLDDASVLMTESISPAQQAARQRLSANLKILRGKAGWSQEALADSAGLHRTYVSQVERQVVNVSLDNIVLLAQALNVQPSSLLNEPSEQPMLLKRGRKRRIDRPVT